MQIVKKEEKSEKYERNKGWKERKRERVKGERERERERERKIERDR